jgi:short-subunit dehydrogenase
MRKENYFKNKIIVITGGSSGIGYALAERIASFNPRAIILLSHEQEKLQRAVARLNKIAPNVSISLVVADISDSNAVISACTKILFDFGSPHILVNNAGYAHYQLFHEMPEDEIVRHVNVNLIGAMRVVHALLPAMRDVTGAQIINIASIAGHMLITPNLVYCAAKHGMVAWSEGLAIELAADSVIVQTISPGRVLTDFFRHESFQTRVAGAETRLTVPMNKVIDVCINAIVKRKKRTIVPSYWALIAWSIHVCPFLMKRLYYAFLQRRIARLRK